jgi:hypothetical protein
MSAPLSLEGLLAVCDAATPGPWLVERAESWHGQHVMAGSVMVADVPMFGSTCTADCDLIAACSPEVVRALVRVAQAALAERKERRSMDEFWTEDKSDQYDIASEELTAALGGIEGVV